MVLTLFMGNYLTFLTLSSSLKEDLHLCLLELYYDSEKVTSLSFLRQLGLMERVSCRQAVDHQASPVHMQGLPFAHHRSEPCLASPIPPGLSIFLGMMGGDWIGGGV